MLKHIFKDVVFLTILFLFSCSKESVQQSIYNHNDIILEKTAFRVFIGMDKIHSYAKHCFPNTRSNDNIDDYTITPYLGANGDTLMYVVNFGNGQGWKILSADARTPALLAEGETGAFSLEDGNDGVRLWMDCLAEDMANISNLPSSMLKFSEEDINNNLAFWSIESSLLTPREIIQGNWVVQTTVDTLVYEVVEHMVPRWDQWGDYNHYCPFKSDGSGSRAPAGCVALAGSEVLYYLHNKLGVPATMVSEGYCTGDVNNYSRSFSSPNSTIWTDMDTLYHYPGTLVYPYPEALLVGFVGSLADMNYNNDYSWTLPAKLRTQVFEPLGISCSHGSYNENIVKASLDARMPVIVTASDLLIPLDFEIHCFVIDGFKKTYLKKTHYHYWDPNEPDPTPEYIHPPWEPYYTYTYTTPEITAIKINWGWWSQWHPSYHLNDGWYTLTGDWYTINSIGHEATYNHNRTMIYGFSISE